MRVGYSGVPSLPRACIACEGAPASTSRTTNGPGQRAAPALRSGTGVPTRLLRWVNRTSEQRAAPTSAKDDQQQSAGARRWLLLRPRLRARRIDGAAAPRVLQGCSGRPRANPLLRHREGIRAEPARRPGMRWMRASPELWQDRDRGPSQRGAGTATGRCLAHTKRGHRARTDRLRAQAGTHRGPWPAARRAASADTGRTVRPRT
jgi:hypothetical protein